MNPANFEADAEAVSRLVIATFAECCAGASGPGSLAIFADYAEPNAIIARTANHLVLMLEDEGRLIGAAEIRDFNHLSMCFIHPGRHGQGLGRALWTEAYNRIRRAHGHAAPVTVHAATNARGFYQALGFTDHGPLVVKDHGPGRRMHYQPMRRWPRGLRGLIEKTRSYLS